MRILRLVLCLFCLLLACCNKQKKPSPVHRDHLNLSFKYDPQTTDPRKNADPLTCALIGMLYEGLLHEEPDGTISCALADSYQVTKGGRKITFILKEAYWSNGQRITSYDFEKSWKKILDPSFAAPTASLLYPIKNAREAKKGLVPIEDVGIKCPDSKTLEVKLLQPTPHFISTLTYYTFYPVWERNGNLTTDDHPHGVFSGPFRLNQWQHNDHLILTKNPYFWAQKETSIKRICIQIIPNELTSFRLFELGEIDWLGSFYAPIPQDMMRHVKKSSQAIASHIAGTTCCFFNLKCYPFNNLNIRKAFAYAIDRTDVVENFTESGEKEAFGIIPPLLKNGQVDHFMPKGSKELALHHFELGLKELNLTRESFPKLTFDHFNFEDVKRLAQIIQHSWKETLDIEVSLQSYDVKVFLDKLAKKNYQFCLMSMIAQYNHPYNIFERFYDSHGVKNFSGWNNHRYRELLDIANYSVDENDRSKYFSKAESVFIKDMPVAPIFYHSKIYLKNRLLQNVQICPTGKVDFRKAFFKPNHE